MERESEGYRQGRMVPILMYHHINDTDDWFATSQSALIDQMGWLAANGYVTVGPSDLALAMSAGTDLPAKPVMITIDDGNATDVIFAEVLSRHDFRGVYFWPDTSPLTERQMCELAAQGEIGAHTRTHPDLSVLSVGDQRAEIASNRARLQTITGQQVSAFAYPYGKFNDDSASVVDDLGFDLAFDADGVPTTLDRIDRLHVPRFEIPNGVTLDGFIARVEAWR